MATDKPKRETDKDPATRTGGGDQRSPAESKGHKVPDKKGPLEERVRQIDKNEEYEDVIGRHEPNDRYPDQRR